MHQCFTFRASPYIEIFLILFLKKIFIPALYENDDYEDEVGTEPAEAIEDGDTGAELDDGMGLCISQFAVKFCHRNTNQASKNTCGKGSVAYK